MAGLCVQGMGEPGERAKRLLHEGRMKRDTGSVTVTGNRDSLKAAKHG
jgi:hypothetical protein